MVLCNCLLQCGSPGSKINVDGGEIHMLADWPLLSVEVFPVSQQEVTDVIQVDFAFCNTTQEEGCRVLRDGVGR